jgi:TonB family protein
MYSRVLAVLSVIVTLVPPQTALPPRIPQSVVHLESLEYPRLALFARIQGEVRLAVAVDSEGRVQSVTATSGNEILRQAAKQNISTWRFQPGSEQTLTMTYKFKLEKPPIETPRTECKFDLPGSVSVSSNEQAVVGRP